MSEPGEELRANQALLFQVQVLKPQKAQTPLASGVYSRLGDRIRSEDQPGTFQHHIKGG